jgi:branched-chain amino acid transport system substrate-binding protein
VASVGTYSGPIGSALEPILKGAQLWVKAMNAKGGLNGHQIKLFVYDDGADPAKHRAQVQDAVEHRGILGFLMNAEGFTGAASVEYLNAKRIPVVGMDLGEHWAYSSPMYFPQGSVGDELVRTYALAIAQQVLPRGKQRFGTLTCIEAPCERPESVVAETARKAGLDHVYRGRASLAQPDYTAECLSARNQTVEVFAIILDVNSVNRVTAACARQGFHPLYAVFVMDDGMKDNPELAGALAISPVFPFFQSGTPATDEFRAALRDYGGEMVLGNTTALGWAAGKLLERAARAISEPPTTESLLTGLWTIKAETLGGLTAPLTFVPNEPPAALTCWFNLTLAQRAWVSPDGFKMNCQNHGQ